MQSTIGELVLNTTKGYIVFCAAQLGLVDHLANKSMNADELSKLTNTHSNSLYRLLRGLASLDFLKEDANGVFTVTETGHYLRDGVKGSIKYPILYHFGTHCVALPQMIHTLKTGETAFDHLFGTNYYDYLRKNPKDAENCMKSLTQYAADVAPTLIYSCDLKGFKNIVDVGGGNGAFLKSLLEMMPQASGTVFDEDYVIDSNAKIVGTGNLNGRINAVKGDFFKSVPANGDCYILKYILHNWNDEQCKVILENIRKESKSGTKLIVFDDLLDDSADTSYMKVLDCLFMSVFSGKMRTESEMKLLLQSCGFHVQRVIRPANCFSAITEATAN